MAAQSVGLRPIAKPGSWWWAEFSLVRSSWSLRPARAGEGNNEGFIQTNLVPTCQTSPGSKTPTSRTRGGSCTAQPAPWWVSDNNGNVSTLYNGSGTVPCPEVRSSSTSPRRTRTSEVRRPGSSSTATRTTSRSLMARTLAPACSSSPPRTAHDRRAGIPQSASRRLSSRSTPNPRRDQRRRTKAWRSSRQVTVSGSTRPIPRRDRRCLRCQVQGSSRERSLHGQADSCRLCAFGIQAIGNRIYVTYAVQNATKHDDLKGAHRGFVDVFSTEGKPSSDWIRRGPLNSPWGLAVAPKGFGDFGGDLLVGNFGDGRINAYDIHSGEFEGTLLNPSGAPIVIDGRGPSLFGNDHPPVRPARSSSPPGRTGRWTACSAHSAGSPRPKTRKRFARAPLP